MKRNLQGKQGRAHTSKSIISWRRAVLRARGEINPAALRHTLIDIEGNRRGSAAIAKLAKRAGAIAAQKAKVVNLPQVMYKNGQLVSVSEGREEAVFNREHYFAKVKVGRVYARPK